MAAFNVSLDDSSPLISYSPSNAWSDSPANDTLTKSYFSDSLHTTSLDGASASFTFNGTGVWFYGGIRPDYGSYTFWLDGTKVAQGDARADSPELQHLLAGVGDLKLGEHTVVLRNAGGGPIDVDAVVFETSAGTTRGSVTSVVVDDTNPAFSYRPSASDWELVKNSVFFNDSLHFSQTQGAQAVLSFTGDAVAIYGTVSPQHANYTVALDGHTSQQYDPSNVRELHSQTLLYFASNLGAKEHTLTLTGNPGKDTGKYLDVDFIQIYGATGHSDDSTSMSSHGKPPTSTSSTTDAAHSTTALNDSAATATPSVLAPSPTTGALNANATSTGMNNSLNGVNNNNAVVGASSLSGGAVAGIVIGCFLGLIALLLLLFFLLRRRRSRPQVISISRPMKPEGPSPDLPIQYDPDLEAAYGYDTPNSTEKQIQMRQAEAAVYAELDAMGKRITTASKDTRWSNGSYDSTSTLRHNDPPPRKWANNGPMSAIVPGAKWERYSTHTRKTSETSTVVGEEIRQGVSEVVLRPSRLSDGPRTAPVRPSRPASLAFSLTEYYYET